MPFVGGSRFVSYRWTDRSVTPKEPDAVAQKYGICIQRIRAGRHKVGEEGRLFLEQSAELEPVEIRMAGIQGDVIGQETEAFEYLLAEKLFAPIK